jgi:hypothetical protein
MPPKTEEMVTIKPDLRVIHPEYGDITEDVARAMAEIRQEDHAALVRDAERLQATIAAGRPGNAVVRKNFALKAEIHPAVHAHWRMRHGAGFWKHELDWFLKRNPQCRVRAEAANPTVVVPDVSGILTSKPVRGPVGKRGRWAL